MVWMPPNVRESRPVVILRPAKVHVAPTGIVVGFVTKVLHGVASTSAAPASSIGDVKLMSLAAIKADQLGWASVQPGASVRPWIVYNGSKL